MELLKNFFKFLIFIPAVFFFIFVFFWDAIIYAITGDPKYNVSPVD